MRQALFLLLILWSGMLHSQEYDRGLLLDDFDYQESPSKISVRLTNSLPPSHSLKAYSPQPGNQFNSGSSVGWSIAYGARTMLDAIYLNRTDPRINARSSYSPNFVNEISQNEDCYEDISLSTALEKIKAFGAPNFLSYLDYCTERVPYEIYEEANKSASISYSRIFDLSASWQTRKANIQYAITQNFPVIAGLKCPPSFENAQLFWQPLENPADDHPGHAVTIIGYDNDLFGGAFEVLNSWGRDWGEGGFTWIRYADMKNYLKYGYEMYLVDSVGTRDEKFKKTLIYFTSGKDTLAATLKKDRSYEIVKSLPSGTEFTISINTNNPGFFYCLYQSARGETTVIHPPNKYVNEILPYGENYALLPDKSSSFRLDNNTGTETFCFIFSERPLELHSIFKKTNSSDGFIGRVKTFLKAENTLLNFDRKRIAYSAEPGTEVIPVFVSLKHVR